MPSCDRLTSDAVRFAGAQRGWCGTARRRAGNWRKTEAVSSTNSPPITATAVPRRRSATSRSANFGRRLSNTASTPGCPVRGRAPHERVVGTDAFGVAVRAGRPGCRSGLRSRRDAWRAGSPGDAARIRSPSRKRGCDTRPASAPRPLGRRVERGAAVSSQGSRGRHAGLRRRCALVPWFRSGPLPADSDGTPRAAGPAPSLPWRTGSDSMS